MGEFKASTIDFFESGIQGLNCEPCINMRTIGASLGAAQRRRNFVVVEGIEVPQNLRSVHVGW